MKNIRAILVEHLRTNATRTFRDPDKTDAMLRETILEACNEIEACMQQIGEMQREIVLLSADIDGG